jgi:hypothetical protein
VVAPLEATKAVVAPGALTEEGTGEATQEVAVLEALAEEVIGEVMVEVTGKLKK